MSTISSNEKDSVVPPRLQEIVMMTPHGISVDDDLEAAAKQVKEKMKVDTNYGLLNPDLLLKEYGIFRKMMLILTMLCKFLEGKDRLVSSRRGTAKRGNLKNLMFLLRT
ncbi:hypothetical protein ACHQM5_002075 [Ranunculus cassubicifolius]